eukprot:g2890.t1
MTDIIKDFCSKNSHINADELKARQLLPLLEKLKVASSEVGSNLASASIRKNFTGSLEARIIQWYTHMTNPSEGSVYNRLLVQDTVGHSRTSTYNLPPGNFTYGDKNVKDPENAGEVALSWKAGRNSEAASLGSNFVKMNRDAVIQGAKTARDVKQFYTSHQEESKYIRTAAGRRSAEAKMNSRKARHNKDIIFGRKNKTTHDIKSIVGNVYGVQVNAEPKYKDLSGKVTKGRLPKPKPTRSSELLAKASRKPKPKESQWKLKRFQKK